MELGRCFRLTRPSGERIGWRHRWTPSRRCRAGPLVIPLTRAAGQRNGAVGENRTHDLSLTKGLRYHYATTATVVFRTYIWRGLNGFGGQTRLSQGCAAIT